MAWPEATKRSSVGTRFGSASAGRAHEFTAGKLTLKLSHRIADTRDRQWTTQTCPSGFSEAARLPDPLLSGSTSPKQPFVATRTRPLPVGRPARQSWPCRAPERQVCGDESGAVFDLTRTDAAAQLGLLRAAESTEPSRSRTNSAWVTCPSVAARLDWLQPYPVTERNPRPNAG